MTGPEHYREAERLLQVAAGIGVVVKAKTERVAEELGDQVRDATGLRVTEVYGASDLDTSSVLAAAQVHATLALAAATLAPNGSVNGLAAWSEATS